MRIMRFADGGATYVGRVDGDKIVPIAAEAAWPGYDPLRVLLAEGPDGVVRAESIAASRSIEEVTVLAPLRAPEKIVAIGLNYADHIREAALETPARPLLFVKTANSLIGPDDPIVADPQLTAELDYEVELAVVISRVTHRVGVDNALDHVLGYTICNDISARDVQFSDQQWVRGKSFDSYCPLGPAIVTTNEIENPQALGIRCFVNGTALQDSSTAEMVFGVRELVSFVSQGITLHPGDVITTGTPHGVGYARTPPVFLGPGDVVECEIDGIGRLRNPVVAP